ncbi:uncharacterized protein COLE_07244 [Cutaneotrichosporon oleaginosum]|uniref:uncharacterized protein n=1 Tax=Cutaneotrichosporon oleaginosum TaxID=879819 RepID=UPI001323422F|nr:hypothetical protein COLE_07244 [Cutaneotrichosporon oleaginosum]
MSKYGGYMRTAQGLMSALSGEKPHSSITDWIEVLSSDRYDEGSLDGIPELVDSVNLQGPQGTTEAARAIRKKLKYGNTHRQVRALVILRALTENAGPGFKLNWANQQIMERLRDMATDSLLDPKVKKRLILVFHAWSIQYADEPRMSAVAGLWKQYAGVAAGARRAPPARPTGGGVSSSPPQANAGKGFSSSDPFYDHSWEPAAGQRGKDTYADLDSARADAEERKREREQRMALERREAEIERREREVKRKQEMAQVEARRRAEAEQEAERRRKAKEERKSAKHAPKRPKFNFEKEKPQVLSSVANANLAASNLVNSIRLLNREVENVTESPRVQDCLDKAKAARRAVVKYIQVVTDEEFLGTLLEANERIVTAIQLYDKMSKPAALDSDSDDEESKRYGDESAQVERIRQRLQAQKLESQRTGEIESMQEAQKAESQRRQARAARRGNSGTEADRSGRSAIDDLAGLDLSARNPNLPRPIQPDPERSSMGRGSLSDFSDYDSSDEDWRASHSRQSSRQEAGPSRGNRGQIYRGDSFDPYAPSDDGGYAALEDEGGKDRLLEDPFGDPFGDDQATTPRNEKQRMECE